MEVTVMELCRAHLFQKKGENSFYLFDRMPLLRVDGLGAVRTDGIIVDRRCVDSHTQDMHARQTPAATAASAMDNVPLVNQS